MHTTCEKHCLAHLLHILLVGVMHGLAGVPCSAHSKDPLHLLLHQVLRVVAMVLCLSR